MAFIRFEKPGVLQDAREAADLSRADVAEQWPCDWRIIAGMEGGVTVPLYEAVARFAEICGTTAEALLQADSEIQEESEQDAE